MFYACCNVYLGFLMEKCGRQCPFELDTFPETSLLDFRCFNCNVHTLSIWISMQYLWDQIGFHGGLGLLKLLYIQSYGFDQHILNYDEPRAPIYFLGAKYRELVPYMGFHGQPWFMVETDVNACREPSTPVDTVLLLVKTGGGGQKRGRCGSFQKEHLDKNAGRSANIYKS